MKKHLREIDIEKHEDRWNPSLAVARSVKRWIEDGKLTLDQRLPSVRALAETFETTRYAICEALKLLESDGWIEKQSQRYHVMRLPRPPASDPLQTGSIFILADAGEVDASNILIAGFDRVIEVGAMIAARQSHTDVTTVEPAKMEQLSEQDFNDYIDRRLEGVIGFHGTMINEPGPALIERFRQRHVPIVMYGNHPKYAEYDTVESDHEWGGYQLVRFLIDQGCRRILPFMPVQAKLDEKPSWLVDRMAGYRRAIEEAGLEALPELNCPTMPCEMEGHDGYAAAVRTAAGYLLEYVTGPKKIDAVMTVSDKFAFPVITACRDLLHKKINEDICITGYDNYWMDCHLLKYRYETEGPIATVDKRNFDMGRELVKTIKDRNRGNLTGPAQHFRIKPELIVNREK